MYNTHIPYAYGIPTLYYYVGGWDSFVPLFDDVVLRVQKDDTSVVLFSNKVRELVGECIELAKGVI